ncbi:dead end protein 1 isoform X2 [Mugil cephalus]|uniref:dead end protein 1 isoform X2 n=1 Tax=Mugil cephalus TaxID=48193 RepID=UPI001FB57AC4|nr:dead end protein 1 isoform X2 [Mugil cephalus]
MEMIDIKQLQMLNLERVVALETWLTTTNTKLIQVNGQRKYGGPPEVWDGPIPGARCEVFISHIPRDTYEDQLIPLFSSVGPLWEFRLMMNFSGQNRGFAYAKYGSSAIATQAIHLLHGYMIEPGACLSVNRSVEKRHLSLGALPTTTKQEDLLKVLRLLAEGVERVALKTGPGIEGTTAIVGFSSHYFASIAKKMLVEAFRKQYGLTISVKWHSSELVIPDKPWPTRTFPMGLPSPPKPPRHALKLLPSVLPPHLAVAPSNSPGFCRAVGGPIATKSHPPSSSSHRAPPGIEVSPLTLLRRACEVTGVGQPSFELHYSHIGPDGFLYYTYKVNIPGITSPFTGQVMILPGPSLDTIVEEAEKATAQEVLQKVFNSQFAL